MTAIFILLHHLYRYKVTLQTSIEFTILLCIFLQQKGFLKIEAFLKLLTME